MKTAGATRAITLLFLVAAPVLAIDYTSVQNGDWSSTSTWSPPGTPGAGDNVLVSHTVAIDGAGSVNNVTIDTPGTLTCGSDYTLLVSGDWVNNGTATLTSGTVSLVGATATQVGGTSATSFRILQITKTSYLTVTMNQDVTAAASPTGLYINRGRLLTNGNDLTVPNLVHSVGSGQCGTLEITGSSVVTIGSIRQDFIGVDSVKIGAGPTSPQVTITGSHVMWNSGQTMRMWGGTLTYTSTGPTTNLMLSSNNTGWGCYIYGGTVNFYGSTWFQSSAFFVCSPGAVVNYLGVAASTAKFGLYSSSNSVSFDSLVIGKTDHGVTFTADDFGTTNAFVRAARVTVNSSATLTLDATDFGTGYGYDFGSITNDGAITVNANLFVSGDALGDGAWGYTSPVAIVSQLTFDDVGAGSFHAGEAAFYDVTVNKPAGSLTLLSSTAVEHSLLVSGGAFAVGENELTLGTATASGSVTVNNGCAFSAVGNGVDARASVTAPGTDFPYAFDVLSGGTIAAGYADFSYMDADGISIAAGATIDATDNFSYCSFDHGSLAGPMLKVENSLVDTLVGLVFAGSAGYNIEKTGATGHLAVLGGGGSMWGESFDNDPDNLVDWVIPYTDAQVVSIGQPSGTYQLGDSVTPSATWKNNSTLAADFEAWTVLKDPGGATVYAEEVDVVGLAPGGSILIETFPAYQLNTAGNWTVRCSTYLVNDQEPGNDVQSRGFSVGAVDAGIVSILSPGTFVDTGATVIPSARIRNNSSYPMTFDAWFILTDETDAEIYRYSTAVAALAGGETRDVTWAENWPAPHAEGPYAARCSLAVSDENAGNNELGRDFTVGSRPPWGSGWVEVMPMPLLPSSKTVKRGGWLAMGPEGLVYATKGYKTGDFYRYDAFADTWTILADVQAGAEGKMPEKGCRGASDGMNTVYMTKGNNTFGFWGYDVAANTWAPLSDVPAGPSGKKVKGGTDLVYVPMGDSTGYVYMLKGYKTEFWRYDPATGMWEFRANAPVGIKEKWDKGSWLAYDGENTIYAHKAKYYTGSNHEMWKYDIPGDSWSGPLKGMPLAGLHSGRIKSKKAKDGSAGAYFDGSIYALKGGNTQQFFMYDVAADTWTEKDTVPTYGSTGKKKRVKVGADLVHWGGGAFFALKGNKTLEAWRYVIPAASAPRPERGGVADNGRVQIAECKLQIVGNPLTGGVATLRYSLPKAGPATVRVFDALGREVLGRSVNRGLETAPTSGVVNLDLRGLSAGIYLVKVEAEGFTGTQKLVIQH